MTAHEPSSSETSEHTPELLSPGKGSGPGVRRRARPRLRELCRRVGSRGLLPLEGDRGEHGPGGRVLSAGCQEEGGVLQVTSV